ncbi:hypothetical protein ACHAXT_005185 [Thalassiosira profunda]
MAGIWDDQGLLAAAVAIGVVVATAAVLMRHADKPPSSSPAIVPLGTYNVFSAIRGMTGESPHAYLLELIRRCGCKTFRLPLPILQVREFRYWGWRLPVPRLRRVFAVCDARLARRVLQDPLSDKPREIYTSFEGITGTPVMFTSTNGEYTRSVRRTAHRFFAQKKDGKIVRKCTDRWLDGRVHDLSVGGTPFDPLDEALHVTFQIMCEAAFRYETTYHEFRTFADNLDLALVEFAYRQSTNPLRKIFGWMLPSVWRAKRSAKQVMEFAEKMLQQGDLDGTSFIDLMLENPNLATERQRAAEIVMFMAAGHETTGAMIANVMILLAEHSDVQDRLRRSMQDERRDGGDGRNNTYLKQVLLEANRVMPVAPMGSTRLTGRDFMLKNKGGTDCVIPAGSICLLPQYPCYTDEGVFGPNPDQFDPGRWENCSEKMREASSTTFSLGPRSCPGKPLAMEEMNYLIPHLIGRYSLRLKERGRPEYCVIQKHAGALLRVEEVGETKVYSKESPRCNGTISKTLPELIVGKNIPAVIGLHLAAHVHTARVAFRRGDGTSSLKIAVLTEPSPVGSYICGQSKRIEYLMQYLVETSNDTVELITTEVNDAIKPSEWRGVKVHYTCGFPLPSYNQISISFDCTGKALRELYRFWPDIIHATTPGPLLFPSIIASRLFGIPLVMSCHTHLTAYARTYLPPGINVIAEWGLWRFTAIVHSFADLTLVTSPQIKSDFDRNRVPNVEVWQKGVNATQFNPNYYNADMRHRMTSGNVDDFLLVYIGRLAEEKRLSLLKEVIQRLPGSTLCLVGTGPYEQALKRHFEGTNTVFLGQLTGIKLSQAFASADVFFMPSTSETLGFVVLEAMASSTPVVAANAGGLKSLIENGTTGFLVNPDVASGFVSAAEALRTNLTLRENIADAARMDVEQWTWQSSMEKLRSEVYPRAIQSYRSRANIQSSWRRSGVLGT